PNISPEDKQDLLEDVTAETTNIIIGNSLKKLGPLEDLLTLGTPTVTSNRAATIKHSHAHIFTCSLEKDDYIVTASFVPN
ncbi:MAG: chemotaxis protein CheX, partial [Methanomassiliicoccales archaeon]